MVGDSVGHEAVALFVVMVAVRGAKVVTDDQGVEIVDRDIVFGHDFGGASVSTDDLTVDGFVQRIPFDGLEDGGGTGPDETGGTCKLFNQSEIVLQALGILIVRQVAGMEAVVEMDDFVRPVFQGEADFLEQDGVVRSAGVGHAIDVGLTGQTFDDEGTVSATDGIPDQEDTRQGRVVGVIPPVIAPFVFFANDRG